MELPAQVVGINRIARLAGEQVEADGGPAATDASFWRIRFSLESRATCSSYRAS